MQKLSKENINTNIALFYAITVLFIPPIIKNEYITLAIVHITFFLIFFMLNIGKLKLNKLISVWLLILFVASFLSFLYTFFSLKFSSLFDFRYLIIPIEIFCIFFIINIVKYNSYYWKRLNYILIIFLVIHIILCSFYLIDSNIFHKLIQPYIVFERTNNASFWRFFGLWALPTHTSLGIVLSFFIIRSYKINVLSYIVLFATVIVLFIANSRAAIIAFLASLFISLEFNRKNILYFLVTIFFIIVFIINYSNTFLIIIDNLTRAFQSISLESFYYRFLRLDLLDSYWIEDPGKFVFGHLNFGPDYTDNNYILFIKYFGILGLLWFLVYYLFLGRNIFYKYNFLIFKKLKQLNISTLVFVFLYSGAHATFSHPRAQFLLFSILFYNFYIQKYMSSQKVVHKSLKIKKS